MTGARAALWVSSPAVPTALDWAIGTTAFGSEIDSGTASLSNTFQSNLGTLDVYESTFVLNESLDAGTTYWLTLQNADAAGSTVSWDLNGGPSSAQQAGNGPIPSESFQILGPGTPAPEPVSATLLGLAGAALLGYCVERRRA